MNLARKIRQIDPTGVQTRVILLSNEDAIMTHFGLDVVPDCVKGGAGEIRGVKN